VNADAPPDRVPLSFREEAPAWTAIVALAVLAWIVTVDQVRAMGNGAGTMGMSFVAFVAMWTAMMTAMMFPSVAPGAILWTRSIVYRLSGLAALSRIALFVSGYLLAWAFAGVVAFFGLVLFERVLLLAGSNAGWLGAAIFITAGVYQFTSFKDVCLRHCRSPMSLISYYTSFRGLAIDLRVGVHHGIYQGSAHETEISPHHSSPVSVRSHRNLDKPLRTRHGFFECRPSPACRTGNGEALEYRANSCIRDIRILLERCLIHSLSVTNLETRQFVQGSLVDIHPEAMNTRSNLLRRFVAPPPLPSCS